MFFRVNDVGNANYIQIFNAFKNSILTVDFGLQQKNQQKTYFICSFLQSSKLLISHYHQDHYIGLYYLEDNSTHIEELYYPMIPNVTGTSDLKKQVLFLEFIQNLKLGSKSGSPAKDLIELTNKKNRIGFKRKALKQGDSIYVGDLKFDVVWPPEKISTETGRALSKGIKEINDTISSNDALNELWEAFDRNGNDNVFSNEEKYVEKNTEQTRHDHLSYLTAINAFNDVRDDIPDKLITELSEKIRKLTNRFSVCLYLHNQFLFLGDLESNEINRCIEFMKKEYQINHVNNLIAAHHGSHWGNKLLDIYAENVISSNGKKLSLHFNETYKQIGKNIYSTYLNGNLSFSFKGLRLLYNAEYPYWYLPWF